MALPEGIETCTVTSGVPVTFGGAAVKAFVSVEPSVYLVHTATGTPLVDFLEEQSVTEGVAAQFTLPVDQDGFQDENGNAYRGWFYTARITYSTTSKAKNKTPKVKVFQLVAGQTLVDLDTLPGGVAALPYTAPLPSVTSVNGQTGAVTVATELPARLGEEALNATIAAEMTPVELAQAQRIAVDRAGQSDRQSAQGAARIAFEDSTAYSETWANLTGWTVGASTVTVAGGKLQGAYQLAGVGISRGISIAAGFRAKGVINNVPGGLVNESAMIGVSKTAPGAAWVAGDRMAIGFTASGNMIGYEGTNLTGGTGSTTLLTAAPAGAYGWTIDVDAENVSITITTPAGVTYRRRRLLSQFGGTVQTLVINNNDARAGSGITFNGFGYRESHASLKPAALEATGYRAEILAYGLGAGQEFRVIVPDGYDSRRPLPFIISAHGNTQDEEHFSLSAERQALATAIIGAGYGYASHSMHGNNWGSPDGVNDLRRLYLYLKANYPLGPVVLLGESMGGLASWSAVARKTIPVAGLGVIDGVANLRWNWDNGTDGTTLDRTRIITAYGIAGDGSDYATKTAGYDPALQPAEAFTGVPIQITTSGSDSRIPMGFHGRLMSDKLTGHADVTLVEHTGPHTDGTAFAASMWMPFIDRCVSTV